MGRNLKTSEVLERFYAGQTSAAEEQELTGRLDEASAGDKALFRGLSGMRVPDENVPVPEDLSRMIERTVDRELGRRSGRMRLIASVSAIGVAAAIAAVAFLTPLHIEEPADTFDNPEEAYAAVVEALGLIGQNLGKGMSFAAGNIRDAVRNTTDNLEDVMRKVNDKQ